MLWNATELLRSQLKMRVFEKSQVRQELNVVKNAPNRSLGCRVAEESVNAFLTPDSVPCSKDKYLRAAAAAAEVAGSTSWAQISATLGYRLGAPAHATATLGYGRIQHQVFREQIYFHKLHAAYEY